MKRISKNDGFKTGISDANDVLMEGTIVGSPHVAYKNIDGIDRVNAVNVVIESSRYTSNGIRKFQYDAVVFDNAEELLPYLVDGAYIRFNGHLISVGDLCKPVIDYPQIEMP